MRERDDRAFRLLAIALMGSGVGLWTLTLLTVTSLPTKPWPTISLVAIALASVFVQVEVAAAGRHMVSLAMTDAAIVFAALLGRPAAIPLIISSTIAVAVFQLRPPLVKIFFNLGQELTGAALGLLAFAAIRDSEVVSTSTGIGALVAGIIVGLVSALAIALGSHLTASSAKSIDWRSLTFMVAASVANAAIAVQAVYLGSISLALGFIPLLPLGLIYVANRGVSKQQRSTDRTELLYRATSALHEHPNLDDGLLSVLEQVRQAVRAHHARVVLFTPDGAVTCQAANSPHDVLEMTAADASMESAARHLAAELPGAILVRSGTPAASRSPVSIFGQEDSIVAPLVHSSEPAGLVVIMAQPGGVAQLYQSDVELVDVLAKQIGLALEKGFLEKSLRQLIALEEQLTKQAYYDSVTGLANRNYLNDELQRLFTSDRPNLNSLLLVDLDDFKTVNDSLGHVAGDKLLAIAADRLVHAVGDQGLVTRIGGDEFAIVLYSIECEDHALKIAEHIIAQVSQVATIDGREVGVGASVGVRMIRNGLDTVTDAFRDADLALYNAKALGKGRYATYEPSMHIQVQERLALSSALANAVERNEFVLAFQPIYELSTGRLAGVESLVRWRHPDRGELLPGSFLALTEETGLIVQLGQHVFDCALDAVESWAQLLCDSPFYIAVNVSGRQLQEPGFADAILRSIASHDVDPTRVVLEITESIFISDEEHTREILQTISSFGIRLGLDDFGTGYSSLSQLHRFPLHQLKIDRAFVSRIDRSSDDRNLVRAIIQLASALQMDIVAEGIETDGQLAELVRLGCKRGQGWLLGRPQTAEGISTLLVETQRQQEPTMTG